MSYLTPVTLVLILSPHYCFFFSDPATTLIYTLSLHDALPISVPAALHVRQRGVPGSPGRACRGLLRDRLAGRQLLPDRKSTRLNSSHVAISYAVFCLKKKK